MLNVFETVLRFAVQGSSSSVQGVNSVNSAVKDLTGTVDASASSFKNLAGAFTAVVVANRVVTALKGLITASLPTSTALMRLKTLTNATGEQLEKFRQSAIAAAAATPFTPPEAIDALVRLTQATGNADAATKALLPTLQLAMASFGRIGPEQATKMMGEMIRGFRLTGDEAGRAAGKIYALAKYGGVAIEDFARVQGKLAAAAGTSGQNFEDVNLAFTMARRVLPNAELVGTGINRLSKELGSAKARAQLESYGIKLREFTTGAVIPLSSFFAQLSERYRGNAEATSYAINQAFGTRTGQVVQAVMRGMEKESHGMNGELLKAGEIWGHLAEKMKTGSAEMKKASDDYMESPAGRIEILEESLNVLKATLGDMLTRFLNPFLIMFTKAAVVVRGILENPLLGTIVAIGTRLLAVSAVLWSMKAAWWGIAGIIAVTLRNVAGMGSALGGVLTAITTKWAYLKAAGAMAGGGIFSGLLTGPATVAMTARLGVVHPGAVAAAIGNMSMLQKVGFGAKAALAAIGPVGWVMAIIAALPEMLSLVEKAGKILVDNPQVNKLMDMLKGAVGGAGIGGGAFGWAMTAIKFVGLANKQVEDEAKIKKKLADDQVEAAKKSFQWLQLGTDQYKEVLDRIEKISSKAPPVVHFENLAKSLPMMRALLGSKDTRTAGQAATGIEDFGAIAKYLIISQKRELLPGEHQDLMAKAARISYGLLEAGSMGNTAAGQLGKLIHNTVVKPLGDIADKGNLEATAVGDKMAKGDMGLSVKGPIGQMASRAAGRGDIVTEADIYAKMEARAETWRKQEAKQRETANQHLQKISLDLQSFLRGAYARDAGPGGFFTEESKPATQGDIEGFMGL